MERHLLVACIVLAKAEITYKKPVTHDIKATASIDKVTFDRFVETFEQTGKARLEVLVSIGCNDEEAVQLSAQYVAFKSVEAG